MMETESRLPELEILLNGKTQKRMTADLIRQITEVPDVYRFRKYIILPKVQELRGTEQNGVLEILELFSRGTFQDYMALRESRGISLTEKQIFTLRSLSLAVMAKDSSAQKIPFDRIQKELGFTDAWETFDFLIEVLNHGYVKGKLDELSRVLHVDDWATRDLQAEEVADTQQKMETFLRACTQTVEKAKNEANRLDELKSQSEVQKMKLSNKIEALKASLDDAVEESRGGVRPEPFLKSLRGRGKT